MGASGVIRRRRVRRLVGLSRVLVSHRRSAGTDLVLATILAAVAGAANAGGFFALGRYTSHMTGYISQFADNAAILDLGAALVSVLAVFAFVGGSAFSTILINAARFYAGRSQYAWPLVIQGALLALLATGGRLAGETGHLVSLACLCFIMGMQNATITKISSARIRTTHATGMVTDIGIELGRAAFGILMPASKAALNPRKLRILGQLVSAFLIGGVLGAIGVSHMGFSFFLALAGILLALGLPGVAAAGLGRAKGG